MSKFWASYEKSEWKAKRWEVFKRDGHKCISCGHDGTTHPLEVDHGWYERGKEAWEYPLECFSTYCSQCHESIEGIRKDIRKLLARCSEKDHLFLLGNILAWVNKNTTFHKSARNIPLVQGVANWLNIPFDELVQAVGDYAGKIVPVDDCEKIHAEWLERQEATSQENELQLAKQAGIEIFN